MSTGKTDREYKVMVVETTNRAVIVRVKAKSRAEARKTIKDRYWAGKLNMGPAAKHCESDVDITVLDE